MAVVLGAVQVVFAIGVAHIADAHFCGYCLQLAIVVHLAGEAVEGVVGEDQLDDVLTQFLDAVGVGIDVRAWHNGGMARRHGFRRPAWCQGHIHTAHAARPEWVEVGSIAQGGHRILTEVPPHQAEDGFPILDFEGLVVDIGNLDVLLGGSGTACSTRNLIVYKKLLAHILMFMKNKEIIRFRNTSTHF